MARKKIVFVIVEGSSDDTALGVLFSRIYDKNTVHVEITHGDITSAKHVDAGNIVMSVADFVRNFADNNHFTKKDFQQIIHLIDTDGAYIPDEHVLDDSTAQKPIYSETEIRTTNRAGILKRNAAKSLAMDKLVGRKTIWGVPYQAYYMSSNLDHALYGKQNSSDEEKEADAYAFAKRYKDDISAFLRFLCASDFSVGSSYVESWKFIRQNLHSLQRHTNLGICFRKSVEALSMTRGRCRCVKMGAESISDSFRKR